LSFFLHFFFKCRNLSKYTFFLNFGPKVMLLPPFWIFPIKILQKSLGSGCYAWGSGCPIHRTFFGFSWSERVCAPYVSVYMYVCQFYMWNCMVTITCTYICQHSVYLTWEVTVVWLRLLYSVTSEGRSIIYACQGFSTWIVWGACMVELQKAPKGAVCNSFAYAFKYTWLFIRINDRIS